jgi:hypothetical protein
MKKKYPHHLLSEIIYQLINMSVGSVERVELFGITTNGLRIREAIKENE